MKAVFRIRRGFTLVEIMIVVLIIGMLLAIAVPNFLVARTRSRAAAIVSDLKEIESAKDQYILANGLSPGNQVNNASDLVPGFLNQWPAGPIAGTYLANPVNTDPTFNTYDSNWYMQHCVGSTADSSCPL